MKMKRFWLGEVWDECKCATILVKSNQEGRNLGKNCNQPQEYCKVWYLVWAHDMTDARRRVAAGEGIRHT